MIAKFLGVSSIVVFFVVIPICSVGLIGKKRRKILPEESEKDQEDS